MNEAFEFFVEYVLIWLVLGLILFLALTPFQRLKQYYVQVFKWFRLAALVVLVVLFIYLLMNFGNVYERVKADPLTLILPVAVSVLGYTIQKIYERFKREEEKEDA
ncbi:hypothetical protein PA598K_06160 [Paenibacillus sp. 598K]|nr:hypothetical protein PA598K_06160 [Paenibacillus sp. 598K]